MSVVAVALFGLILAAPPELPPDIDEVPPAQDADPPADSGDAAPPADSGEAAPPAEGETAPPADEPIPVTPEDDAEPEEDDDDDDDDDREAGGGGGAAGGGAAGGAAAGGAAAGGTAAGGAGSGGSGSGGGGAGGSGSGGGSGAGAGGGPAIQQPGSSTPQTPGASKPTPQKPGSGRAQPSTQPSAAPAPSVDEPTTTEPQAEPEPEPEAEPEEEEKKPKKLGGFRLFRIGAAARIGYTHGTSAKNGLYDRQKSIDDTLENMMLTTSGAGAQGKTRFGGFQYGFILDAEVVGINVWLDFHKFFTPGGMWSLLLGYDHEFGFGKRLRLDVGVAGGLNHVFLGSVLKDLYYDKDNPAAVNIGTLGVEGRAMVDLHIKLVGPLFTGPYAMIGYHYLWSANVAEVTAEKGLHYSAGWSLRLDFAAPKILGRKR